MKLAYKLYILSGMVWTLCGAPVANESRQVTARGEPEFLGDLGDELLVDRLIQFEGILSTLAPVSVPGVLLSLSDDEVKSLRTKQKIRVDFMRPLGKKKGNVALAGFENYLEKLTQQKSPSEDDQSKLHAAIGFLQRTVSVPPEIHKKMSPQLDKLLAGGTAEFAALEEIAAFARQHYPALYAQEKEKLEQLSTDIQRRKTAKQAPKKISEKQPEKIRQPRTVKFVKTGQKPPKEPFKAPIRAKERKKPSKKPSVVPPIKPSVPEKPTPPPAIPGAIPETPSTTPPIPSVAPVAPSPAPALPGAPKTPAVPVVIPAPPAAAPTIPAPTPAPPIPAPAPVVPVAIQIPATPVVVPAVPVPTPATTATAAGTPADKVAAARAEGLFVGMSDADLINLASSSNWDTLRATEKDKTTKAAADKTTADFAKLISAAAEKAFADKAATDKAAADKKAATDQQAPAATEQPPVPPTPQIITPTGKSMATQKGTQQATAELLTQQRADQQRVPRKRGQ